jgi:hypothetical protein
MKIYYKKIFLALTILFSYLSVSIKTDSVCDLETLKLELLQDLADNNMLDCLRIIEVPHNLKENEQQRNIRLAAQWDTSCSFEADSTWIENMKTNYGVTQLVNSAGDPVTKDFEDQADMCELIRAAVSKNLFEIKNLDMQNLPSTFVDAIQCAGPKGDLYGPQICAATSSSFFSKPSWNIFNKSSVIHFDNKPQYIEKEVVGGNDKNPWADSGNKLESVSSLDLLPQDVLDSSGADLAKFINKALKGAPASLGGSDEGSNSGGLVDGDINTEKSSKVHHYYKRIDTSIQPEKDFKLMDNGQIMFSSEGSKILMATFMVSYKFNEFAQFCIKLGLNEIDQPESRQCLNNMKEGYINGAFADKYTESDVRLAVMYLSSGQGEIKSDGERMNMNFGAVTFPDNGIYKHKLGLDSVEVMPALSFSPLENFSMNINNRSEKPEYFIVITNFCFKMPQISTFGTLMTWNGRDLDDTILVRTNTSEIGISNVNVIQLFPGNNTISVKYMYQGAQFTLISSNDQDKYNQSITAFKLPRGTKVRNFKITGPVNLNANSWTGLNLNAKISLSSKTHVMILFHLNVRIHKTDFSARLKVNGNKSFKSTLGHVKEEEYANIQGYMVKRLPAGDYDFDIEFINSSNEILQPNSEKIDNQTVSIKIIELP